MKMVLTQRNVDKRFAATIINSSRKQAIAASTVYAIDLESPGNEYHLAAIGFAVRECTDAGALVTRAEFPYDEFSLYGTPSKALDSRYLCSGIKGELLHDYFYIGARHGSGGRWFMLPLAPAFGVTLSGSQATRITVEFTTPTAALMGFSAGVSGYFELYGYWTTKPKGNGIPRVWSVTVDSGHSSVAGEIEYKMEGPAELWWLSVYTDESATEVETLNITDVTLKSSDGTTFLDTHTDVLDAHRDTALVDDETLTAHHCVVGKSGPMFGELYHSAFLPPLIIPKGKTYTLTVTTTSLANLRVHILKIAVPGVI